MKRQTWTEKVMELKNELSEDIARAEMHVEGKIADAQGWADDANTYLENVQASANNLIGGLKERAKARVADMLLGEKR